MTVLRSFAILVTLTIAVWIVPCRADTKPDFSGTWKLKNESVSEIYTIEHQEPNIRLIMKIEDGLGKRTLDVKGIIDGKEHKQIVNGSPATFVAKWNDDVLTWETKRETEYGVMHNRRTMKLSKDGKVITAERTRILPEPEETWTKVW